MSGLLSSVPHVALRTPRVPLLASVRELGLAVLREVSLRRDIRTVSEMDDATLADLGLRRGEVESAVRSGRGASALRLSAGVSRRRA